MLDVIDTQHTLLHRRIRHHHEVVLVHAHTILSPFLQRADDLERHIAHADGLADGVFTLVEQLLHDGLANQADLGIFLYVFFRKVDTRGDFVFADFQIVGGATIHRSRPVFGAVHQLPTAIDHGTDHGDILGTLGYQFTIPDFERLHVAGAHADAATPLVGTHHHDEVGAHVGELVGGALFQALAQVNHRDNGSNADDDAEHGKG